MWLPWFGFLIVSVVCSFILVASCYLSTPTPLMHTLFHYSCHEARCSLSLNRSRRWCCWAICQYITVVQTISSSVASFITTLVTCRSLPRISCLRLLGCYMLYCKSEAKIGFKLFMNTIIPTLLYLCSLQGNGNNSLGTVTCGPVHVVPLSLRRRSGKEKLALP